MADLLKGLTGGSWALLVAWFLPAGVVVGVLALAVYPTVQSAPMLRPIHGWDTTTRSLVAGFLVVVLAIAGNALQTQLYRILEGYLLWRQSWFDRRSEHHRQRKQQLRKEFDALPAEQSLARARVWERYRAYPDDDGQVGPTELQNALRAFETFADNRYGFDSQSLWTELTASCPKIVNDEQERARASVEFFVALFWGTLLVALCSFGAVPLGWTATHSLSVGLLVFAAVLPAVAYGWYRAAVASVPYWRVTVQAMVNLGRLPLASSLGLRVPATLAEEREMWTAFHDFVSQQYSDDRARALDPYRAPPQKIPDSTTTEGAEAQPAAEGAPESD